MLSSPRRLIQPVQHDRLDWACRRGSQDSQPLRIIRVGVVDKDFVAVQLEHVRRQKYALREPLAPIEIDDESHELPPSVASTE